MLQTPISSALEVIGSDPHPGDPPAGGTDPERAGQQQRQLHGQLERGADRDRLPAAGAAGERRLDDDPRGGRHQQGGHGQGGGELGLPGPGLQRGRLRCVLGGGHGGGAACAGGAADRLCVQPQHVLGRDRDPELFDPLVRRGHGHQLRAEVLRGSADAVHRPGHDGGRSAGLRPDLHRAGVQRVGMLGVVLAAVRAGVLGDAHSGGRRSDEPAAAAG